MSGQLALHAELEQVYLGNGETKYVLTIDMGDFEFAGATPQQAFKRFDEAIRGLSGMDIKVYAKSWVTHQGVEFRDGLVEFESKANPEEDE